MSIADKLVYLNDTKTALADAINIALSARGEAPLDTNATFRSYAERLFYPGYLFGQGEQGTYSLPPNASSYFTDTAGTTPAALTDAIALVQGEVGPDWTQGTATARPVWAREPEGGRRNLLGFTEDVSQWGNLDGEVTLLGGIADPDGGTSAIRITGNSFLRRTTIPVQVPYGQNGLAYTTRVWARSPNGGTFTLFFANALSGTVTPTTEWAAYDVTLTRSGTANPSVFQLRVGQDGGIVEVWHPQSEVGSTPTPYQRVTTAADVTEAGVPSVPYARFDLVDDVLTTTLPAATYTVVLPTRQGIWFDSVSHAGGNFSVGPTSYTGGPAGILTALESDGVCKLVAPPLVIGRALSAGERNALVQWYQARGAGPELELGPELVVNGTFDSAANWTLGTNWSIANGVATTTALNSASRSLIQPLVTEVGDIYIYSLDIVIGEPRTGYVFLRIDSNLTGDNLAELNPASTYPIRVSVARAAIRRDVEITTGAASGGDTPFSIDNVSIRRIQPKVSP